MKKTNSGYEFDLIPCPKCGGEIHLYSRAVGKYNCFAKCKKCSSEYPLKTHLKSKGTTIYPQSMAKAEREWNKGVNGNEETNNQTN